MDAPLQLLHPHVKDLGGFSVRRLLPAAQRRTVGPFVFFDHMGPAVLPPGVGMDVRPHPHIGLATVTYLFEGVIDHRDSLGSFQPIHPGDVNWMTAGRGIVHSERTPMSERAKGLAMHGIQIWIALPQADEETTPFFMHHPAASLPRIDQGGCQLSLIAGSAYGHTAPARTFSPMFYLAAECSAGARLALPGEYPEKAVYVVQGQALVNGEPVPEGSMAVLPDGGLGQVETPSAARLMLLGGAPLDGERTVWWNFVASRPERIEAAKARWMAQEFGSVPGETEWIPLPGQTKPPQPFS